MKRFFFSSLIALAPCLSLSARAEQFNLNTEEMAYLNESAVAQQPVPDACEALKPKENSAKIPFNASPCSGAPRKIIPNQRTLLAATFACGRQSAFWETYCSCQGKQLNHDQNQTTGDIYFVDCSKDPNSSVDCGSFECK